MIFSLRPAAVGGDARVAGPKSISEQRDFMKLILLRLEVPGLDYWHDRTLAVTSQWAGIAGMDIALQAWAKALQDEGINVRVVTHTASANGTMRARRCSLA